MPIATMAEAILSDRELVIQFESLGDNCELGLVQRMAGAEPLGLLRFAGVPLRHLIRAMEARFEGMADTANIRVEPQNGCDNEYWPTCADEYWPTPRVSDLLSRAEARLSRSVCFVLPVMVSFPFAAPWCGGTDRSPSLW
jgi:hypothetical protein